MAVVYTDVIDIAPEFSGEASDRITRFINRAALSVNQKVFGNKADLATTLLAAHMLTMSARSGSGGAVASEKVGDLARTYAKGGGDGELDGTSYGSEFKRLRRECVISPAVITQSGSLDEGPSDDS